MALSLAYSMSLKNLPEIMKAIQEAGVPGKFTNEFLKSIGFTSSNDRTMIGVLKGIIFLDNSGTPTDNYKAYKDRTIAKQVLAKCLKEGYEDVFLANENAQTLSQDKIKGIMAARTGKSDAVVEKMAATFKLLCNLADFSGEVTSTKIVEDKPKLVEQNSGNDKPYTVHNGSQDNPTFHYNIQIHLPVTKDISVYNSIFKSLREHLF